MAKPIYEKLTEHNGVPVDIGTRDKWYKSVKKILKDSDRPYDFAYRSSGDSIVIGVKHEDGEISIWDAQIRREADFNVGAENANG